MNEQRIALERQWAEAAAEIRRLIIRARDGHPLATSLVEACFAEERQAIEALKWITDAPAALAVLNESRDLMDRQMALLGLI